MPRTDDLGVDKAGILTDGRGFVDGEQRRDSDRIPGYALYINPPLGRSGMT
jgi:hypothetical protein